MAERCVFCRIVARQEPASVVHEDDVVVAFMDIRPVRPGTCLVIPRAHVDHFTDLDEDTLTHLVIVARRIGRRMREVFQPLRVGMVVSGFGVPHAHLILVPLHGVDDITSARYAAVRDGRVVFNLRGVPLAERSVLDEQARLLAGDAGEPG